jgi:4-carboxymuconolactone decarboxylase
MQAEGGSHSRRPASPRIPPLADAERDARANALLAEVAVSGAAANIFATLVRHPGLFRRWLPFGGKLLAGRLPARDRELLILRTGWLCGAEYEWGQHVPLARQAGLTDAEIAGIQAGPDDPVWSGDDAAVLTAADELHGDACITDETWAALAARYDERQLIEIPMLVGHYHLVAFTLNSLGVQREAGVPGFAGEAGEEAGDAGDAGKDER